MTGGNSNPENMAMLLSSPDFLNVTETMDAFQKTLESIKEVVECRADIIIKRKEKHQQVLDHQIEKLKRAKEDYLKKSDNLSREIEASKNRLLHLEYSIASTQNDKSAQEQANTEIVDRLKKYELDIKKKHTQFLNTTTLLSMLIGYYKNLLGVTVELDKDNPNIVSIIFERMRKSFVHDPFIKVELIEKNKFKFVEVYPMIDEFKYYENRVLEHFEVLIFIYKFREQIFL